MVNRWTQRNSHTLSMAFFLVTLLSILDTKTGNNALHCLVIKLLTATGAYCNGHGWVGLLLGTFSGKTREKPVTSSKVFRGTNFIQFLAFPSAFTRANVYKHARHAQTIVQKPDTKHATVQTRGPGWCIPKQRNWQQGIPWMTGKHEKNLRTNSHQLELVYNGMPRVRLVELYLMPGSFNHNY